MADVKRIRCRDCVSWKITVSAPDGGPPFSMRWVPDPAWDPDRTRTELDAAAKVFEERCAGQTRQAAGGLVTLQDYFYSTFLPARKDGAAWSTSAGWQRLMEEHVFPLIGDVPVRDILPADMEHLFLIASEYLSPSTLRGVWSVLRAVLDAAAEDGALEPEEHPMLGLVMPAGRDGPGMEPLTREELGRVIRAVMDQPPRWQAFFALLLDCGLHTEEAAGLRWTDLDDRGTIRICRKAEYRRREGPVLVDLPEPRLVQLGDQTLLVLNEHRLDQEQNPKLTGTPWILPAVRCPERPLPPVSAEKWLQRMGAASGCPGLTARQLRRTAAETAMAAGGDPEAVRLRFGYAPARSAVSSRGEPDGEAVRLAEELFHRSMEDLWKQVRAQERAEDG